MPIRTKPWSEVTLQDVEDLVTREIREDATIEFKERLDLARDGEKREFLKDITAMANATGGTIVYGAVEGRGDRRGQIVQIQGQALDRDHVEQLIMNLLRDGLDERLDGVLFKALPTAVAGEYVCVLRIPASPLAPHRLKSGADQFFLRGSVSNSPMNTRQIREMILQRETATERVLTLIDDRTRYLKAAAVNRNDTLHFNVLPFTNPDQVILHVVPLFSHAGGWRLGPERQPRFMSVRALGAATPYAGEFYAKEGMYSRFRDRHYVLFMRHGGLEFQRYDVLERRGEGEHPLLKAWMIEQNILRALEDCAALTEDGFLPLPVMVSVRLLDVGGSLLKVFQHDPWYGQHQQTDPDVYLTPVIINAWGPPAEEQIRQVFDEMWQAWHLASCQNYYPDGTHHRYNDQGYVIPWVDPAAETVPEEDAETSEEGEA